MKNPAGYGSITRMKGSRRKPYRVRVTTGFEVDEDGRARQIQRTVGTYATYEEAVEALAAYNRNPLSLEPGVTFAEIYARWSAEQYAVRPSTSRVYRAAFAAVASLHDREFKKLKRNDLQNAIDTSGKNYPTMKMIRLLFQQLYKYAQQNDIVEKDYSRFVDISRHKPDEEEEAVHTDIKPDELAALWAHADDPDTQEVLMLIYSGLRVGEFLALRPEDVDTGARFLTVRRSKTAAGRRRVPIAAKTLAFWQTRKDSPAPNGFLIESGNAPRPSSRYKAYKIRFEAVFASADLPPHLPHDTRHTTASMLHAAGADPYVVKRIIGHAAQDITESVYTHLSDAALLAAIDRL